MLKLFYLIFQIGNDMFHNFAMAFFIKVCHIITPDNKNKPILTIERHKIRILDNALGWAEAVVNTCNKVTTSMHTDSLALENEMASPFSQKTLPLKLHFR